MDIKKPRIVAVDDEKEFASMLKEYFELRGYDINVSSKAVEGIELINQKKPDVVILDLKMPGISGDEVLKVLKLKQPDIKVIFVTAFDDGGKTKKNLLALGAYAYLDKPINSLKELEDIIIKTNK
jgi:two-component system, response regulator, stage 0 sporulation protein F